MSHFYSKIQGGRGEATRCGTKNSGVTGCVASWDGAIRTELWYDRDKDLNMYSVMMIPWHGVGDMQILHTGIVGKAEHKD